MTSPNISDRKLRRYLSLLVYEPRIEFHKSISPEEAKQVMQAMRERYPETMALIDRAGRSKKGRSKKGRKA